MTDLASMSSQTSARCPSAFPDSPSPTCISPRGCASLYERFCGEVEATEPELWARWDAYRRDPAGPRSPRRDVGNLVVADGAARQPLRGAAVPGRPGAPRPWSRRTQAYDDLFRFKIDFVRRRALPLLKGGAHVQRRGRRSRAGRRRWIEPALPPTPMRELRWPAPAAPLLDREERLRGAAPTTRTRPPSRRRSTR